MKVRLYGNTYFQNPKMKNSHRKNTEEFLNDQLFENDVSEQ